MIKYCAILMLCLITGCSLGTKGEARWEICVGFHTKQISENPSNVEIKSTVINKVVDSLTDKEVSNAE